MLHKTVVKCIRCGRKLTDKHSREREMGPVCAAKSMKQMQEWRERNASEDRVAEA